MRAQAEVRIGYSPTASIGRSSRSRAGRQYTIGDDDGERTYGIWYIPPEACVIPVIVDMTKGLPFE